MKASMDSIDIKRFSKTRKSSNFRGIREKIEEGDDSFVITEGLHKGIQCLRSPPPKMTPFDKFLARISFAGEVGARDEDITIKTVEHYLALDSSLKPEAIAKIVGYMKDTTRTNIQVAKKIRRFFVDNISLWQGLAVYILKCRDPTSPSEEIRKSNLSDYTFDSVSQGSSASSDQERFTRPKDQGKALPTLQDLSENSSYRPALDDDGNRNLSHVDDGADDSDEENPSTKAKSNQKSGKDAASKWRPGSEVLNINPSLISKLGKVMEEGGRITGRLSFLAVARRVRQGIAMIRAMVRLASQYSSSEMDPNVNRDDSIMNFLFKSFTSLHQTEGSQSKINSGSSSQGESGESDTEISNSATSSEKSSESEDSQDEREYDFGDDGRVLRTRSSYGFRYSTYGRILLKDIVQGIKNGEQFFDDEGREIVNIVDAVAVTSEDVIETLRVSLKGPERSSSLKIVKSCEESPQESSSEGAITTDEEGNQDKNVKTAKFSDVLLSHSVEVLPNQDSATKIIVDEIQKEEVSLPKSHLPSFHKSHLPSFRQSHLPSFRKSHLPSFRQSQLGSRLSVVVDDSGAVVDLVLSKERTESDQDAIKGNTECFQEIFFNEDRTEAVSLTSRHEKKKFYDVEGRRLVCLPGKTAGWKKIFDQNNQEVLNICGQDKCSTKVFDEQKQEKTVLSEDILKNDQKIKMKDNTRVIHLPTLVADEPDISRSRKKKSLQQSTSLKFTKSDEETGGSRHRKKKTGHSSDELGVDEKVPETITTTTNEAQQSVNLSLVRKGLLPDRGSLMFGTMTGEGKEIVDEELKSKGVPQPVLPVEPLTGIPKDHPVAPDVKLDAQTYMEKHGINELFQMFLSNLVLEQPPSPLDYLINLVHNVGVCGRKATQIDNITGVRANRQHWMFERKLNQNSSL